MIVTLETYLDRTRSYVTYVTRDFPSQDRETFWRLLPAFETAVANALGNDAMIQCPYMPSPDLEEAILHRARVSGLPQATARMTLERLWFHLRLGGFIRRRLNLVPLRTQRDLAIRLSPDAWDAAVKLTESRPYQLYTANEEAGLVKAVLDSLVLEEHLTLPDLLRSLPQLETRAINWQEGWLLLPVRRPRPRATGPAHRQRFALSTETRLVLGRLELFYRKHSLLRPPNHPGFLGPHWNSRELQRLLQTKPGHPFSWRTIRHGVGLLGLLAREGVFVSRRAGRLLTCDPPAGDLRGLGFHGDDPLTSSYKFRKQHFRPSGPAFSQPPVVDADTHTGARVNKLLQEIPAAGTPSRRRALAEAFKETLRELPRENNVRLLAEYAAHLLLRSELRPLTVRNRLTGLLSAVNTILDGASLLTCETVDRLTDLCSELISAYDCPGSMRVMKQRCLDWIGFLRNSGYPLSPVDPRDPELATPSEARCLPLLSIDNIETSVQMCLDNQADNGLSLAAAIVMAGFGGLRRHEVCRLSLDDVSADPRWTIRVRRSKSSSGRRHIPLALLAPPSALALVQSYHEQRRKSACMVEDAWLVTADAKAWNQDQLSAIITRILRKASGNHAVVFHTLRRSSATWLLVRWFAARGWPLRLSLHGVWAKEAFCREALEAVQQLIGTDGRRVLWQIAALYGHLSPEVTLAHYVGAAALILRTGLGNASRIYKVGPL